jgi:molybdopterin-guanine dinucleotide biosynthesis protein A
MGPVVGIEAALYHFAEKCDAVLVLPCDLPEISSIEISALLCAYERADGPVVFAETPGGQQHPLCAVLSSDLRADISAALNSGRLCAGRLWAELGGMGVVFSKAEAFTNLNSLTDLDTWRAKKRMRPPSLRVMPSDPVPHATISPGTSRQCKSI